MCDEVEERRQGPHKSWEGGLSLLVDGDEHWTAGPLWTRRLLTPQVC